MRSLALLLLLGCQAAPPVPVAPAPAPVAPHVKPAFEVRSFNHKKPDVHVEWLVLTLPSAKAAAKISAEMEHDHVKAARGFLAEAQKAKENRDDAPFVSPDEWSLHIQCGVTTLLPELVSIRCEQDDYLGGAHGMQHTSARTYAIEGDDARRLALDDLFVQPWKPTIDAACMDALRRADAQWVTDGTLTSVEEMLHTWNVGKDGLIFAFDPYEAGPYAQGPMQAHIAWPVLAKIRRRPGPLDVVAP